MFGRRSRYETPTDTSGRALGLATAAQERAAKAVGRAPGATTARWGAERMDGPKRAHTAGGGGEGRVV